MSEKDIIDQNYKRMRFKKNKVWAQVDSKGKLIVKNGKVSIKYQLAQDYEYKVKLSNLKELDQENPNNRPELSKIKINKLDQENPNNRPKLSKIKVNEKDAIHIYTDGASSGNPGPSGIGVLMVYKDHEKRISKYIGVTTNNIAELMAIKTALLSVKDKKISTRLYTDSKYAIGVLSLKLKAFKNRTLIKEIRDIGSGFKDLKFIKVQGHKGDIGNEIADTLATESIKNKQKNE